MVVIWLCFCASILTVSSSAPLAEDGEQKPGYTNIDSSQIDYLRGKRLNNNVYTVTPCAAAAAAAASIPVSRSPEATYATFGPPEPRYYIPSAYDYANSGYAENTYRVEDPYRDTRELLRYSDTNFMEQVPMTRFTYRAAPSTYLPYTPNSLNGHYNVQPGAPAYGVFPSGNVGNCNVPLLFSCAPSVVTGQMVPATQVYSSPPSFTSGGVAAHPDGYGSVGEHYAQRIHTNQEQAMFDNSAPVNSVSAAHSIEKST